MLRIGVEPFFSLFARCSVFCKEVIGSEFFVGSFLKNGCGVSTVFRFSFCASFIFSRDSADGGCDDVCGAAAAAGHRNLVTLS